MKIRGCGMRQKHAGVAGARMKPRRRNEQIRGWNMVKDSRFFSEAKKAKEAAAAKASELGQKTSDKAGEVKARAEEVKDQIREAAADVTGVGLAKLNEVLADFNAALPVLREAGYTVEGVDIGLGIPPRFVANFSPGSGVPEDKFEALLAENTERKLTILLMKSLHEATKLQSKVDIKGLKPSGFSVVIGLVPEVTVKFKRQREERADEGEQPGSRQTLPS
jgi:hypothetical protein